ncbi:uncharacterized protein P174DRAFT_441634 [Aspergillus novofumigatus IBT 16806]|uniref:Uncharacterized protein n=1 Tax=Aspergillus novofumigatus (strain IBT 16806) TaxID=1392255 RepID=A0A2I1C9S3_ASPN1|nr:uncharacterized protein P174DRAFT_441634 [Aspergillus novofumigatus IBT 16806]PKX94346.1 hypothetical protein P174DRAFT_441634 [Aspergillus novofumigatus IBT 16806]
MWILEAGAMMFSGENSLALVVWVLQTGMSEPATSAPLHPSPEDQAKVSTFCEILQPSTKLQRRTYRLCLQFFPQAHHSSYAPQQ